jgi:hypothetical protein
MLIGREQQHRQKRRIGAESPLRQREWPELISSRACARAVPIEYSNSNVPIVRPTQDWQGEHALLHVGQHIRAAKDTIEAER